MTASPSPVIIWDIDDVWHPWMDLSHTACVNSSLVDCGAPTPTTWHPWEEYGVEKEAWIQVLDAATITGELYESTPSEEDLSVIRRLWALGADHHFVTARGFFGNHPDHVRALTASWVEEHFRGFYYSLSFSVSKGDNAVALQATHAIDDSLTNYHAFEEAGVETYLMDRPWNRSTEGRSVRRVRSIAEFGDAIEKGITQ